MEKVQVLNIFIDNLSTGELLQQLDERGGVVFTPNIRSPNDPAKRSRVLQCL